MTLTRRRFTAGLGVGVAALALPPGLLPGVRAQSGKPLKMILSVPPGAALDASARLPAKEAPIATSSATFSLVDHWACRSPAG